MSTIEYQPTELLPDSSRCSRCDALRARIAQAEDAERHRLERNLHDGAQQRLVAVSMQLARLSARVDADSEAGRLLQEARDELCSSLEELRDLARGLSPAVLSDHGLAAALESLAFRTAVPVELSIELDGAVGRCVEVAVYYLVAEALTNVVKYAGATTASVSVSHRRGTLLVEIADDGIGGADPCGGSGLCGLADRVEALGGWLSVCSPAGEGTSVTAEIPTRS